MYKNFLFDCDGVILNSNSIKSRGFYHACIDFGDNLAKMMETYHKLNGGISRYEKFNYFINNILKIPYSKKIYENLLSKYALYVSTELEKCKITPNLEKIKKEFPSSKWYIISGGDQKEIRGIFKKHLINDLFDGGIYGSPRDKKEILKSLLDQNIDVKQSIFLGDSLYDYEVATSFGIDFRYIYGWSEFEELKSHAKKNKIIIHKDVRSFFLDIQGGFPESQSSCK